MLNQLVEYIKIHRTSLQQDQEELQREMDEWTYLDSDEYKDMEVEDISLTGQIIALGHILEYAKELEGK